MPKALSKYIEINPKILGGTPVIAGTRIPIERVFNLVRQGYTTKTLRQEYPHLEPKIIQYLIAYLMEAGLDAFEKNQKTQASPR